MGLNSAEVHMHQNLFIRRWRAVYRYVLASFYANFDTYIPQRIAIDLEWIWISLNIEQKKTPTLLEFFVYIKVLVNHYIERIITIREASYCMLDDTPA